MELPSTVEKLLERLERNGYEAYVVGGCVRDSLLGKEPHDWDICTSAKPEQILNCFLGLHVLETGMKHGTITVMIGKIPYEITTFRMDGSYSDGRHPDQVQFVSSLQEDLSRRDFTINAMAYHPQKGLFDFFQGKEDLEQKKIRCVGEASLRFDEDALRILRGLRFASELCFQLDEGTMQAMEAKKERLLDVSEERLQEELSKLLMGKGVRKVLEEHTDVFCELIPEIGPTIGFFQNHPLHMDTVWEHTCRAVEMVRAEPSLRWAMLLHDIAKPQCHSRDAKGISHFFGHAAQSAGAAEKILTRFLFSNEMKRQIVELVKYHDAEFVPREKVMKRWLNRLGVKRVQQLIQMKAGDIQAQAEEMQQARLEELEQVSNCVHGILKEKQCFSLRELAVKGDDLLGIGVPEGKQVGDLLRRLLELVIEGDSENTREALLAEAQKRM